MNQLTKYDAARFALSVAVKVDEVKDIRDKAEAMAAYARQAKDTELVQWATEIKVRAERRAGQMLAEMELKPGKKPIGNTMVPIAQSLSDIGISKNESSRWQKLAAVTDTQFEQAVSAAKEVAGEVTTAAMLRVAKANDPAPAPSKPAAKPEVKEDELDDHGVTSDELLEQMQETQAENEQLQERVEIMAQDDKAAEIDKLLTRIYGLEGRIKQLMMQVKTSSDGEKYHATVIHKLRKLLGVEGHKEIIAAVTALVEAQKATA